MDYVTRQLLLLLTKINEAFGKHNAAVDHIRKNSDQQTKVQNEALGKLLAAHDESEGNRSRSDDRQYGVHNSNRWAAWLTAIFTLGAVVAASVYACITRNMWKEMQAQTITQQQQLEITQRPWIMIEKVWIPADQSLIIGKNLIMTSPSVLVKNVGHTPAENVNVRVWMQLAENAPSEDEVNTACQNAIGDSNLGMGETIFPEREGSPVGYPTSLPKEDVKRYWETPDKHTIVFPIIGCVAYRSNIFPKETYYTGFLYQTLLREYPSKPTSIPGKEVFLQNSLIGYLTR
jgi:hypothetical protein